MNSRLPVYLNRYALLLAWIAIIIIFGALEPELFLRPRNFLTIFSERSILLILTLGMLPGLAAGEYDLSTASTMGLSFVILGWLNIIHGWPVAPAILVALAAALVVGIVNAVVIVILKVPSIVATLGMATLLAGAALGINNLIVSGISESLVNVARTKLFGLQLVFFYALALTLILWYVFAYTPLGRYIYFVGAGRDVARLTGIRVDAIRAGTLIAGSVIAGLAGVLLAGRNGSVDPNFAPGLLLPAFAGAFLGSTTVTPGRFNAWGTFIAVYFLVTGINGLQLMKITGWVEQVFFGAALIIGVVFSHLAGRRRIAGV
ncbi:MAG: ABC transporter permease [bacterium]|nr:ABC transporter permease [bacterium]MDE0602726.1 ABC transporter permease [bacterium]